MIRYDRNDKNCILPSTGEQSPSKLGHEKHSFQFTRVECLKTTKNYKEWSRCLHLLEQYFVYCIFMK